MNTVAASMVLLLVFEARIAARPQSDSAPGKDNLIEQARQHARAFRSELPDFVVNQRISRHQQTSRDPGKWIADKTLDTELSYDMKKGEQIKLLKVDGAPTTESYLGLPGGLTSAGEFGAMLGIILGPQSDATFKGGKHSAIRGEDAVIYDFKVKKVKRNLVLAGLSREPQVVNYRGCIWIGAEAKRVLRIELSLDGAALGSQISQEDRTVDYDWVTIEGQKYLLPVRAVVLLGIAYKVYLRNVIEYVNYHKWEGKIKLVDPASN